MIEFKFYYYYNLWIKYIIIMIELNSTIINIDIKINI
jgi:hypothetical protein